MYMYVHLFPNLFPKLLHMPIFSLKSHHLLLLLTFLLFLWAAITSSVFVFVSLSLSLPPSLPSVDISYGAHCYSTVHGEGAKDGCHEQVQWPAFTGMGLFTPLHTPSQNQALIELFQLFSLCIVMPLRAHTNRRTHVVIYVYKYIYIQVYIIIMCVRLFLSCSREFWFWIISCLPVITWPYSSLLWPTP